MKRGMDEYPVRNQRMQAQAPLVREGEAGAAGQGQRWGHLGAGPWEDCFSTGDHFPRQLRGPDPSAADFAVTGTRRTLKQEDPAGYDLSQGRGFRWNKTRVICTGSDGKVQVYCKCEESIHADNGDMTAPGLEKTPTTRRKERARTSTACEEHTGTREAGTRVTGDNTLGTLLQKAEPHT